MSSSSSSARPARRGIRRRVLLAVSSRKKLRERYDEKGLGRIEKALESYTQGLSKRRITLKVAFLDDASSMSEYDLKPTRRITAVSAKNAIDRLISKLEKSRGTSVSLLILGGGEVIPYFKLSNPTLDSDAFVPSDNPYGCKRGAVSAEKCLLPERPVGRMPDGNGSSIKLLLSQIESASEPSGVLPLAGGALGYTAAVWRKASQQVWSDMGWKGRLRVSPPLSYVDVKASWFKGRGSLYFNLHGSDRDPHWFGQKGTKFTTALSPMSVRRLNQRRTVVLTEACYGAIEMKRQKESSIALAFLSTGSLSVVGSTCVAYGAIIPPVSEADLVALHFFRNVEKGMTVGEALVNARAQLAASAVSRQGNLDDDDRKTILQFVLFGDPTLKIEPRSLGSDKYAKNA
jgi:hypothetical protein